jgi:molecular chaperone GrpE
MVVLVAIINNNTNNSSNNGSKEAPKGAKEGQFAGQNPISTGQNQHNCECKHPHEEHNCREGHEKCDCKHANENEAPKAQDAKVKDLTITLQRLQAEFENYQKRNIKQNEEFRTLANARLIEEMLPVLDSLEQGMKHDKALVIVHEQLYTILRKNGLLKIKAERGMKFDHDKMECLMQETEASLKEDAVVNVLMAGYELSGKILRLAKVSVNSLKANNAGEAKK